MSLTRVGAGLNHFRTFQLHFDDELSDVGVKHSRQ